MTFEFETVSLSLLTLFECSEHPRHCKKCSFFKMHNMTMDRK
uniref:Uncharacterized protein n=1 Tax=Anguilla anguilla TaxID=7936 RepID=A0A0E9SNZ7_ANGAN